jgi:hypothetical protein
MKYFRWRDDEIVVVLNHIDWCLANKQDYWQTIHSKFNKETGRVPDESRIVTRLKAICREQTPRIDYKHLIDRGTEVLEDATQLLGADDNLIRYGGTLGTVFPSVPSYRVGGPIYFFPS